MKRCKIVEEAKRLAERLEGQSLPPGFDHGGQNVYALIRHEHTNYDELLEELNLVCIDQIGQCQECTSTEESWYWNYDLDVGFSMCGPKYEAYHLLKGLTKALTSRLYEEWRAARERSGGAAWAHS